VDLVRCCGGGVRLVVTDFYGKDRMEATERWVSFFAENKSDVLQVLSESMHTYIVKNFEDWKAHYGLIDAKAMQGNMST